MMKKFIKRKQAHNLKSFQNAYQRIQVDSKGCFIATYSFGNDHQITNDLREFKKRIAPYSLGFKFIESYYYLSPRIVSFLEKNEKIGSVTNKYFLRPVLRLTNGLTKKL